LFNFHGSVETHDKIKQVEKFNLFAKQVDKFNLLVP
jgi:hypothetical protein